jgi:hypothetical protein
VIFSVPSRRSTAIVVPLRLEKDKRTKLELEQLDQDAKLAEQKALAERKRIAKRRYVLQLGVDRDQVEHDLAKAQQDVIRLSAQLNLLPPLPTQ